MNIPMKWLNDYVNIDCDIDTYIDAMTLSGSKVEGYEKLGEEITKVVVGKILEIEQHPDADKLVVTQVDVGEEVIQIVTGANNIAVNDYVPVALTGATLVNDIKIKKGKLRGVESNGMMCSVEELGFSVDEIEDAPENGIYIFPKELPLGSDIKPYFGLDDVVVEYEITSNRPDCFSIVGIGREAAATFDKEFKFPDLSHNDVEGDPNEYVSVKIDNEELCPRYMAKIVKNVNVKPSPQWMQEHLRAAGLRPINNIVDITNYMLLEMGQPMHAFDVETLDEKQVIVRNAVAGEKIVTLDDEERELDESMLIIADANKPIAIAGVMGGASTKITDGTKNLLFEIANFHGTNIRMTSKKLGLRTDASTKYEKYLDPNNVEVAMNRACHLIELLGVGEIVEGVVDVYPGVREEKTVAFSYDWINKLLGTDISKEEMDKIFTKIECKVNDDSTVTVPTFRPDLESAADLAEEVARFYGYDKIPVTLATGTPTIGKKSPSQKIEDITRLAMENCGFNEAMTYSFESPKVFDLLNIAEDDVARETVVIQNPLGEDFSIMRTTTLNGMLNSLSLNYNRRNEDVKLYELGKVYLPKQTPITELPTEKLKLTLGTYGDYDFYDVKGVVESLLERLGLVEKVSYTPEIELSYLHPGRKAKILLNDTVELGFIGEVHPEVCDNYNIGSKAYVAVIDMGILVKKADRVRQYKKVAKYPAAKRDLAFLVKDEILVGQLEKVIKQRGGKILESIKLFDVYKGNQIEKGYKSIAYALTFRADDHNLGEKEITKAMNKIVNGLEYEYEAVLRK